MKKSFVFASFLSLGLSSLAATVTDVAVSPRWPWQDKVDIDYTLDAEEYGGYAVTVALYDGDSPLAVAPASLPGNGGIRLPGRRHQVFDFVRSGLAVRPRALRAVVTASDRPVRYLVVDLLKTVGEDGQREYVYAGDGRLVTHKDFPVTYRVSDDPADGEAVTRVDYEDVWFSVTNDSQYARTKMVFRYVPPQTAARTGDGNVSSTSAFVTLTKAYWIAVYPMTQGQYSCLKWNVPDRRHKDPNWGTATIGEEEQQTPMPGGRQAYVGTKHTDEPYDDYPAGMRGPLGDPAAPIGWPTYGHAVSPTNTLAAFREKTGLRLDYPTEAQWEVACRAGAAGLYGDRDSTAANTNLLLRFASPKVLKKVGDGRLPNAWGLYDMLGNCGEVTLDALDAATRIDGVNPAGPDSLTTERVVRGLKGGDEDETVYAKYLAVQAGYRTGLAYDGTGSWTTYRFSAMRWTVELDD